MARGSKPRPVYLDTHIVAWLHDGLVERLSADARAALEDGLLLISPIVELELTYLHEIGRFRPTASKALGVLARDVGLQRSEVPLRNSVREAVKQSWTRDPFDRLIVGEALAAGAALVTRDETILAHCASAVW